MLIIKIDESAAAVGFAQDIVAKGAQDVERRGVLVAEGGAGDETGAFLQVIIRFLENGPVLQPASILYIFPERGGGDHLKGHSLGKNDEKAEVNLEVSLRGLTLEPLDDLCEIEANGGNEQRFGHPVFRLEQLRMQLFNRNIISARRER